jgi:hypothetical protein
MALIVEDFREQIADAEFIIDDQYVCHGVNAEISKRWVKGRKQEKTEWVQADAGGGSTVNDNDTCAPIT